MSEPRNVDKYDELAEMISAPVLAAAKRRGVVKPRRVFPRGSIDGQGHEQLRGERCAAGNTRQRERQNCARPPVGCPRNGRGWIQGRMRRLRSAPRSASVAH